MKEKMRVEGAGGGNLLSNIKAQGLSTNAIILIILGIVVLIVLVLGFTMGWNKILPFFPSNNVENIKTTCNTACSTASMYDFCTLPRTLKAPDIPGGAKEFVGNCSFFSTNKDYLKYGIETCSSVTCAAP